MTEIPFKKFLILTTAFFIFFSDDASAKEFSFSPPAPEEITKAVIEASGKTKVRSAVLFGLLGQETGYGRNVGKTESGWTGFCKNISSTDCRNWARYDCKAGYKEADYYDEILKKLGFTDAAGNAVKKDIPTSSTCALGFTQFEPRTWWLVTKNKTSRVYNPWNIKDSVEIAALYLQDLGADGSEVLGANDVIGPKDRTALQKYYCGARYHRVECVEYAKGVEYKARYSPEEVLRKDLERQLERLRREKEQQKVIQPPKGVRQLAFTECPPVNTDEYGFGIVPDANKARAIIGALDEATRKTLETFRDAKGGDLTDESSRFPETVRKRKEILIEAVHRNPNKAIYSIMLDVDRRELSEITRNCVEKQDTIEGVLDISQFDFEDGTSQTQYLLIVETGDTVILHPALGLYVPAESGARARVKGVRIDNEMIFNGTKPLSSETDFTGGIEIISPPATE